MPKPQDILGQKFGRLSVISSTEEKDANGRTLYKCQCACGGTRLAPACLLLNGRITSCGCAQEQARKFAGRKERNAFTPEEEARRISTIISKEESGVYRRGTFWVAQMKFAGKTYHILSSADKEEAQAARQEIVRIRIESGDEAAVAHLEQIKKARKEERREMMKLFGGFPKREEIAKIKSERENFKPKQ
jgi:hypothetical protein